MSIIKGATAQEIRKEKFVAVFEKLENQLEKLRCEIEKL
jgi:hypothetical protein